MYDFNLSIIHDVHRHQYEMEFDIILSKKGIMLKPIRLRNSLYVLIPMELAKVTSITADTDLLLTLKTDDDGTVLTYRKMKDREKCLERTILIVDDDLNFLEWVSTLLRDEGYTVDTAKSGSEGIESFLKKPELMLRCIELSAFHTRNLFVILIRFYLKAITSTNLLTYRDRGLENLGEEPLNSIQCKNSVTGLTVSRCLLLREF